MQGPLLAAAISPDNTPHGYNLTFAFPMLLFIIVAGALYLRFRSSHRVPGHTALDSSRWANVRPGAEATHSDAAAAQPIAANIELADPEPDNLEEPASPPQSTTSGSTLQEDTGPESAATEGTASGTAQESTEDSE